jgi:hypothetical protein
VVPSERRVSEDRLALALYPVASLMNHSCLPNVAVRFEVGAAALLLPAVVIQSHQMPLRLSSLRKADYRHTHAATLLLALVSPWS